MITKLYYPWGKTTQQAIEEFKETHGDTYDYAEVKYKTCKDRVNIICRIHGGFLQQADRHRRGSGCPSCSIDRRRGKPKLNKLTSEIFIERSIRAHGNKFDYSLSKIGKTGEKVIVICEFHGKFLATPSNHMIGEGCFKCGQAAVISKRTLTQGQFLDAAKAKHNDFYDYSRATYIHNKQKVDIICPEHGLFLQTPHNHVHQGQGCPRCSPNASRMEKEFLTTHSVPEEFRNYKVEIGGMKLNVDGFDPVNKIVYEFYGDFWHGNPACSRIKNMADINQVTKTTYKELYIKTIERQRHIVSSGYTLIFTWESDWKKSKTHSQTHEAFSVIGPTAIEQHIQSLT